MKVVGIGGSPRADGNTEYLVKYALAQIEKNGIETEYISLRDKHISECQACYKCAEQGGCAIQDDFQEVIDKIVEADGLLLGSPVYHSSITPSLKCLLDRAGFSGRWMKNKVETKSDDYQWKGTVFSGKVAAPVTVARRAGQNFAFAQLLLWLTVNDFIVAGSHYWNVSVAGKGGAMDAAEDSEGLNILDHLAENMTTIIKKLS